MYKYNRKIRGIPKRELVMAMRLIDADAVMMDILSAGKIGKLTCVDLIKHSKTIDAVPVVHCEDCKHFNRAEFNCKGFKICPASGMDVTPDDYCSYADRIGGDST